MHPNDANWVAIALAITCLFGAHLGGRMAVSSLRKYRDTSRATSKSSAASLLIITALVVGGYILVSQLSPAYPTFKTFTWLVTGVLYLPAVGIGAYRRWSDFDTTEKLVQIMSYGDPTAGDDMERDDYPA